MNFWFCIVEQRDYTHPNKTVRYRNVMKAESRHEARMGFLKLRKGIKKLKMIQKILLEEYGFFGPFNGGEMACKIKQNHIIKSKRHIWD